MHDGHCTMNRTKFGCVETLWKTTRNSEISSGLNFTHACMYVPSCHLLVDPLSKQCCSWTSVYIYFLKVHVANNTAVIHCRQITYSQGILPKERKLTSSSFVLDTSHTFSLTCEHEFAQHTREYHQDLNWVRLLTFRRERKLNTREDRNAIEASTFGHSWHFTRDIKPILL